MSSIKICDGFGDFSFYSSVSFFNFLFYLFYIYLFIFAAHGLFLVALSRGCFFFFFGGAQASHCGGFSCCRTGAPEHRLSSCGSQA